MPLPTSRPGADVPIAIPTVGKFAQIAGRGPIDRDINGVEKSRRRGKNKISGPFELHQASHRSGANFPDALGSTYAERERRLIVEKDSEGHVKTWQFSPRLDAMRKQPPSGPPRRAPTIGRDLRFNSESLIVAMTEGKCIGGRAWPSVVLHNPEHEYASRVVVQLHSGIAPCIGGWPTRRTQVVARRP